MKGFEDVIKEVEVFKKDKEKNEPSQTTIEQEKKVED